MKTAVTCSCVELFAMVISALGLLDINKRKNHNQEASVRKQSAADAHLSFRMKSAVIVRVITLRMEGCDRPKLSQSVLLRRVGDVSASLMRSTTNIIPAPI